MAVEPESWSGYAVSLQGGAVLLSPDAAAVVAQLAAFYSTTARIPAPPHISHLHRVCRRAQVEAGRVPTWGHEDVPSTPTTSESEAWISTSDAAGQLGLSRRQVTRLANEGRLGEPLKQRGNWMVHRDEVAAYAALQKARTA